MAGIELSPDELAGAEIVSAPRAAAAVTPDELEGAEVVTSPRVDMGPEARARRAGRPQPRQLTSEEAGTMAGPITATPHTIGGRGTFTASQPIEPAALGIGDKVTIRDRYPGTGHGVLAAFGRPRTLAVGSETGEMADPLVQLGTAAAMGKAAGAGAASLVPRAASVVAPAVEAGTANVAAGGDFETGAALGLAPAALGIAAKGARRAAAVIAPSTANAIKNARGWVVRDIAGDIKGASTATARKQLADDAENAATIVLRDRKLDKAIDTAQSGNLEELQSAQGLVRERLRAVETDRLGPQWKKAGEVRSGDYVDYLRGRSERLKATGLTTDAAEADALDAIVGRVTKAKEWGYSKRFADEATVKGGALDGMRSKDAIALLEKQKTGPTAAGIDEEIARIRADGTSEGFNPDTMVPARQIQKHWSDEAGIAYKSMGGIHGTVAFERKLDVAAHLREFRDDMLAKAAQVDPLAIGEIRAANRDYSALKRIENVLDQRINNAKSNAGGASVPRGLTRAVREFKQSPTGFVLGAIPEAAIAGKRAFDKWLARKAITAGEKAAVQKIFTATGKGRGVQQAVAAGVPSAVALWSAEMAQRGAKYEDVAP